MAKIIAVLGTKGGSGKPTISLALGHGLGSLPKPISTLEQLARFGSRNKAAPSNLR